MRALLVAAVVLAGAAEASAEGGAVVRASKDARAAAGGVDAKAEARRLATRAQVHFDLGEYEQAIAAYREAYRVHPTPGLLYNLGQAYRLMGDCVSATTMYRNYLRLAPRSRYRQLVRQHLATLEACHRRRTGEAVPPDLEDALLVHRPGKVGPPLAALGAASLEIEPDPSDDAPGRGRKLAGAAVGGGGLALGAVGAYFAVAAADAGREVSRLYAEGAPWEDIAAVDARGRRAEVVGTSFAIAGGAAVVAGATLYYLGWRDAKQASSVAITPRSRGGAVTVSWGW